MNKNVMAVVAVVIVLGGGIWWMMSGDQYSASTTEKDCLACNPPGKWIEGPICLNKNDTGGGTCNKPPKSEMNQEGCDKYCGDNYEFAENHCKPLAKSK